jgi:hypothetical protein
MSADYVAELGMLVADHRLRRIVDQLLAAQAEVYAQEQIAFEPRWTSTFLLLEREGSLPVTAIASRLRLTHPGVIKLTNAMIEADLVSDTRDANDDRRVAAPHAPVEFSLRSAGDDISNLLIADQHRCGPRSRRRRANGCHRPASVAPSLEYAGPLARVFTIAQRLALCHPLLLGVQVGVTKPSPLTPEIMNYQRTPGDSMRMTRAGPARDMTGQWVR